MNFDDSVHFGFFFRSAFRQINGQNTVAGIGADFFLNHNCNLQIFLCLFLEKLNMPLNTPVTKALQVRFSFLL